MKQLTPEQLLNSNLEENLASILWRLHKVEEADQMFRKIVDNRMKHFGSDNNVKVLTAKHLYAWFLRTRSELTRANDLFEEVVAGRR